MKIKKIKNQNMLKMIFLICYLIQHRSQDHKQVEGEEDIEEEVDIKEIAEGEIIWIHLEGEEIEILIRIIEIKEIGIQMGMISGIEGANLISNQEIIIIIRKSFILRS
jgi:hypothetical protein